MKDTKEFLIKENLNVKKKLKSRKIMERGITLIALVVTIVILLILTGVTLNMTLSDNGLFKKAKDAVKSYDTASEMETLNLSIINYNMTNNETDKLGEKLSSMSAIAGDWKNVTVGENTYKEGWYLVEKGDEITGYGEAKYNWLINYDTGEIIELKDGEYIVANANASGAIVDETLKLNVDPVNLQDPGKWGEGVSFHGGDPQDAVTKSELKFDGDDDYLKVEDINFEKSGGFTFEFYGKIYDDKNTGSNFLGRSMFEKNGDITLKGSSFRIIGYGEGLRMNIGSGDCGSELSEALLFEDGRNAHWVRFGDVKVISQKINYISFSVNFENCEIKAYQDGLLKQITTCSQEYLEKR